MTKITDMEEVYLELLQEFIQREIEWLDEEVATRCSKDRNASKILKKVRNHLEQACQELEPYRKDYGTS